MMPTIKLNTYELVVTFAGECNAALTIGGLTNSQAHVLLQRLRSEWSQGVSYPCDYGGPNNTGIVLVPATIHALQLLQEVEYIPHSPEA
jgi:hypothetical protein